MIYKITRNIQKINDIIVETIRIHPEIRILSDEFRSVKYLNQVLISLFSLSHNFEILNIPHISDYLRITEMRLKEDIDYIDISVNKEISFKYQPRLGKKKCSYCCYKIENVCGLKGKKIKGDYWHKCQYYLENCKIERIK